MGKLIHAAVVKLANTELDLKRNFVKKNLMWNHKLLFEQLMFRSMKANFFPCEVM